jgi:hypothetical protein
MSLSFNDLHDKMAQRVNGLISKEDFYMWLNENMETQPYLSIVKKYAVSQAFSENLTKSLDKDIDEIGLDFFYLTYDLNQMFALLFAYTDIVVTSKHRTIANYDLVMQSGLYDYILSCCKDDYKTLVEKCDRVSGIDSLFLVNSVLKNLRQPSVEEWEQIRDIINNDIDKEKFEIIRDIQEFNDPTMKVIRKSIKEKSAKEAMDNSVSKETVSSVSTETPKKEESEPKKKRAPRKKKETNIEILEPSTDAQKENPDNG